jgi:deoxyribodipyrimidine photo-lyase
MEWWAEAYSSKFSAWLAMGCISPRTIYKEIRAYEKENGTNDSTYWLILNYYGVISFVYVQKYQTKFFLYAGIKGEKENSQSLSNKLFSQWEKWCNSSDFINANMIIETNWFYEQ